MRLFLIDKLKYVVIYSHRSDQFEMRDEVKVYFLVNIVSDSQILYSLEHENKDINLFIYHIQ